MFKIGDFSRIARVSARLLRFYDELGLFVPAHADAASGYRYYSLSQLAQLNRITVLKDLGFSLEQIRDIVDSELSPADLRSMLLVRRADAARTLAQEAQRLRHIESRIAQIETDGQLSADDVVVRAEPARPLLSLRQTVASFDEAVEMLGSVRQQARAVLPKRHGGQFVVVAHAAEFEQDALDLEFGYAFAPGTTLTPLADTSLRVGVLPGVARMAVCVRTGPLVEAHRITARVGAFLEHSGNALAGTTREAFLNLPPQDRMHESVVEMQFPLADPAQ